MTKISEILNITSGKLGQMLADIRDGKKVSAFGMSRPERILTLARLCEDILRGWKSAGMKRYPAPAIAYIAADVSEARDAFDQLSRVFPDVVYLPPGDDGLVYKKIAGSAAFLERADALSRISAGRAAAVVTSVPALMQRFPDVAAFKKAALRIVLGAEYSFDNLIPALLYAGYKRESQVTEECSFSVRGDILDVWCPGTEFPYRIEFFGDQAESIKIFNPETQGSSGTSLEKVEISPATEVFYGGDDIKGIVARLNEKPKNLDAEAYHKHETLKNELITRVEMSDKSASLSYILPLLPGGGFFDFVRPVLTAYDDVKNVYDRAEALYKEHFQRFAALYGAGAAMMFCKERLSEPDKAFASASKFNVGFHRLDSQNRIFSPTAVYSFDSVAVPEYFRDYQMFIDDVGTWMRSYRVHIFAGSEDVQRTVTQLLRENSIPVSASGGAVNVSDETVDYGAIFHDQKTVIIGTYNLVSRTVKKTLKRAKSNVFSEIKAGDYVVHRTHGIGHCECVKKMEIGGIERDYAVIDYRGGDKLYVPVENLDSLSLYGTAEGQPPQLSKLGGADFARLKEKVKASVKEMAFSLIDLYAQRAVTLGKKYSDDDSMYNEFVNAFKYTETDDQLSAAEECLKDLKSGRIMDRLLCGDVGYGKTEVALRAAFKVISEGGQVAMMSPTTILARQHFETAVKRMESFGVKIVKLTRFETPAEIKHNLELLRTGSADLVCGTHRLLSKDVIFKNLAMLVVDEEQRFGVEAKERIKTLKASVNVLSLSATPIPRTLYMSLSGMRDISILDTAPAERMPVATYVTEYTEALVADTLTREAARGGQAFVVYNRVESIDSFAASLASLLPDLTFTVAHGQLPEGLLEKRMDDFIEKRADVLICSTIIENGIDMPDANTMIVVDAQNLGLSQLYQLRGRVGRSNRLAYVYFTFPAGAALSESAYKRLEAITKYTELGSGFKIAMADLEIRGAGSVLGAKQHGHIAKVGYDMYMKLLSDAVREIKGMEATALPENVQVDTDFDANIPEMYIADEQWRFKAYSRISRVETAEERDRLIKELKDIYGPVPTPVSNLVAIALIKNLAAKAGAKSVSVRRAAFKLSYGKVKDIPERLMKMIAGEKSAQLSVAPNAELVFAGKEGRAVGVNFLLNYCKKDV